MAQYPVPPPLRLPDGTLVPVGDAGTQFVQADGQSFQPVTNPQRAAVPAAVPTTVGGHRIYTPAPITSVAAPAASAAAPASKFAALLGKGKAAAGTVGTAIKNNPLGALNAALGMAGAIEYATAKAPALPDKPDTYAPVIRPAQGLNVTSLEAGRRGIQSAQTQAGRATGADTGTTAVTRLLAQQQAGDQQGMLSLKDNEAFQQDQRRVDEQGNAAYDANYKTQRSYVEKKYDLEQRQFEARRQQGAGMSQAALTYFTQDRADRLNGTARAQEAALYAKAGVAPPALRRKQSGTRSTSTSTKTEADSYAKGGTLKIKTKASFGSGIRGRAGKAFEQRMDAITSQAMSAFHASLREASSKRARGLSGK